MMDADTICDRGDDHRRRPGDLHQDDQNVRGYRRGPADHAIQTETVPHEQVVKPLKMFGKHVRPAFRQPASAATGAAS